MSDFRPSENQDDTTPTFPGMRAAGFFDNLPKLTEGFFTEAELTDDVTGETGSHPVVAALDRLTHELHLANLIAWQLGTAENYEREIREGLNR